MSGIAGSAMRCQPGGSTVERMDTGLHTPLRSPASRRRPPPAARAALALAFALGLMTATAHAVDVPNRNPALEERAMREARDAIQQRAWARALERLQPHLQAYPDDADAHNLAGFSLRHLGRHAESLAAYERALALDPAHLGAHEYLGELMLTLGRTERALHHLQVLARLCEARCEEYLDLKRAFETAPRPPGR
jgi:tetratricopeptide (TPR) repeat protein